MSKRIGLYSSAALTTRQLRRAELRESAWRRVNENAFLRTTSRRTRRALAGSSAKATWLHSTTSERRAA